ncbi:MAG: rhodanese-related sulfurtransferase [Candidatus Saccharimonadales bacterium]
MQKILLFYKFTPLSDPEAVRLWQRALCEQLNLKGRILIAEHGINGTVGGEIDDLKEYVKITKQYKQFKGIQFKWSEGKREDFPKLIVKVRPEIVTFGVPKRIKVTNDGIKGGGTHIKPEKVHELVEKKGKDVVFFDGRNGYESEVGRFKNAVIGNVQNTRDFKKELKDPKYDKIKDKTVITYCTGGIRCEVLTVLMKEEGFKEVYQIDGGIVKYGEKFADEGLWEGALYVFDDRLTTKFSDKAKDIGSCEHCGKKTSIYTNCMNVECNKHFIACEECKQKNLCVECFKLQPKLSVVA